MAETINEDTGILITQDVLLNKLIATNLTLVTAVGVLINNNDGTWTYTPDANFNGAVSFNYDVSNGTTLIENTIILDITEVNDAPEIDDVTSFTFTSEELLANATDVNGDDLTIVSVKGAVDNGNGTWTFTPEEDFVGEVSLNFTVSDGETTSEGTAIIDVLELPKSPNR